MTSMRTRGSDHLAETDARDELSGAQLEEVVGGLDRVWLDPPEPQPDDRPETATAPPTVGPLIYARTP